MDDTQINDINPYVGPHAIIDPEKFHGREREVRELIELLIPARIILLHSPSGAGKTSLIQSALVPEMKKRGFRVLPRIRIGGELPESLKLSDRKINSYVLHTLLSLEERKEDGGTRIPIDVLSEMTLPEYISGLTKEAAVGEADTAEYPAAGSGKRLVGKELLEYVSRLNKARSQDQGDENFLLVFDQFEEILTLNPTDIKKKREFFVQLGEALEDDRFWALFSMREDYVAALNAYLRHIPTRLSKTYRLDLLGAHEALHVIRETSKNRPVRFTDRAAIILVNDLRKVRVQQPGGEVIEKRGLYVEPVHLQVVCRRLWAQKYSELNDDQSSDQEQGSDQRVLYIEKQHIQRGSGVNDALSAYFSEQVEKIAADTGDSRRKIRAWIEKKLITEDGFRRPALPTQEGVDALKPETIKRLVDAYLLREERRQNIMWLELAHDRLVKPIRISNRASLQPFQVEAARWESGRRPERLLSGDDLSTALTWVEDNPDEVTEDEQHFLKASLEQRQRIEEQQRHHHIKRRERIQKKNRRQRELRKRFRVRTFIVASFLVLILIGGGVLGAYMRTRGQTKITYVGTLIDRSNKHSGTVADLRLLLSLHAVSEVEKLKNNLFYKVLGLTNDTDEIKEKAISALFDAVQNSQVRATLLPESGAINDLDYSPDGNFIATASDTLGVWDAISGLPIELPPNRQRGINAVAFSPTDNRLATAGADGTVLLWQKDDLNNFVEEQQLPGHSGPVTSVSFSSDGKLVATSGADKKVSLWNIADKKEQAKFDHQGAVRSIAFNYDDKQLAVVIEGSNEANTVVIWDVKSGGKTDLDIKDNVYAMAFNKRLNPDNANEQKDNADQKEKALKKDYGKYLATACDNGTIIIWNIEENGTGKSTRRYLRDPGLVGKVLAVAFSPNGKYLGTAGEDRVVRLWDVVTGEKVFEVIAHTEPVRSVAFGPHSGPLLMNLATASDDGTVKLLVASPGNFPQAKDVAFSQPKPREQEDSTEADSAGPLRMATIMTDGTVIVNTLSLVQNPNYFSVRSDAAATDTSLRPDIKGIAFRPGTESVAVAAAESVTLWNTQHGGKIPDPAAFEHKGLRSMAFSADGNLLATSGNDRTVKVWDVQSGRSLFSLEGHLAEVNAVAFNPKDKKVLASVGTDGKIIVWRTDEITNAGTLKPKTISPSDVHGTYEGKGIISVAFSPDGQYLATGGEDKMVRLWRYENAEAKLTVLKSGFESRRYKGAVNDIAFSARNPSNSKTEYSLAVASGDGTMELLRFDASQRIDPKTIVDDEGSVQSVSFSPDGRYIAAIGADRIAHVYLPEPPPPQDQEIIIRHARRLITRSWTTHECTRYLKTNKCPRELTALDTLARANFKAKAGKISEAIEDYQKISVQSPRYPIIDVVRGKEEAEAKEIMTESHRVKGYNFLGVGDLKHAAEAFKVMEGAGQLLEAGQYLAKYNEVSEALELYAKADGILKKEPDPMLKPANYYNTLCWYGSWWSIFSREDRELIQKIMHYCDEAVRLDKNELAFVDSRGVARAVAGEHSAAIEDFETYLPQATEEEKKSRLRWIDELRKNKEPFTIADIINNIK